MMKVEPQDEHRWLEQLLGDWTLTMDAPAPQEGEQSGQSWSESVRHMGGIWIVAEGKGAMPDGTDVETLMTLGYDPAKGAFVGTWAGSMMTHMWVYRGTLDASGKVLTLDCEGPDFENPGQTLNYQDIITIEDGDHRTLTARVQGTDGEWREMMKVRYTRNRAASAAA